MKKIIVVSDSSPLQGSTIDEVSGFLTAPVILARTGIQMYSGYELGLDGDDALKSFGVYRPESEVFDQKSIDTFINLVSTNDHPTTPVTVLNVKGLQVGTVSGVVAQKDEGVLKGILTITDQKVIDKIRAGKQEVSVGYAHNLKKEKGTFDGIEYDFVQTDIEANHLAIVDAGRCGSACKITLDHKKEKSMIITIDGIEFNVEDTQLVQAIKKQQSAHDAETEELKAEKLKADEEKEEMEKKKDEAEAAKDSMAADTVLKFSADAINKMVTDKALLLETARGILKDKMPECTGCDQEIKAAVIDKVSGLDVSGKSAEYINAAYDMAVAKAKKAKGSLDELNKDFQTDSNKTTREAAHAKYVVDHLGGGSK